MKQGSAFALALICTSALVAVSPALAAGQANSEAGASDVSDIVVTAQKRSERLIDVPQSVTVISSETLTKRDANQFRDIANLVPGLALLTAGAGFNQVSLRGVTTGLDTSSLVGIYIDEVPYGSSSSFARGSRYTPDGGTFDIDHLEVLQGPQGTLYGATSMGGILKYVTKSPDATAFKGDVQIGASTTRAGGMGYNGAAAVNLPIGGGNALRLSVYDTHDGGYIDNVTLRAKDVNRADLYGGRADLLLTPTDRFTIRLVGVAQNIDRDGTGTVDWSPGRVGAAPLAGDLKQVRALAEPYNFKFRLISATATYELGGAKITSASSYQTVRTTATYELTGALKNAFARYGPYSGIAQQEQLSTDKFTQEARVASTLGQHLNWAVGGYYNYEDSSRQLKYILQDTLGNPAPNTINSTFIPRHLKSMPRSATLLGI